MRSKSSAAAGVREFNFAGGVRGKYAARFAGSNVIVLAPDVASVFPSSRAVNGALRAYREQQVAALVAELKGKPSPERQKLLRARLRKLGHRGGLSRGPNPARA